MALIAGSSVELIGITPWTLSTAATIDIPFPTYSAGDLLVLWTSTSDAGRTITCPSGWDSLEARNSYQANQSVLLAARVADGNETDPLTVTKSGTGRQYGTIAALRGWRGGTPTILGHGDINSSSAGIALLQYAETVADLRAGDVFLQFHSEGDDGSAAYSAQTYLDNGNAGDVVWLADWMFPIGDYNSGNNSSPLGGDMAGTMGWGIVGSGTTITPELNTTTNMVRPTASMIAVRGDALGGGGGMAMPMLFPAAGAHR